MRHIVERINPVWTGSLSTLRARSSIYGPTYGFIELGVWEVTQNTQLIKHLFRGRS